METFIIIRLSYSHKLKKVYWYDMEKLKAKAEFGVNYIYV